MIICGIDPGSDQSAVVVARIGGSDECVTRAFTMDNQDLRRNFILNIHLFPRRFAIEKPVCYVGGKEIGDTCLWCGRLWELALFNAWHVEPITRAEIKKHFGVKRSSKKNGKQPDPDSQILTILAKRFGTKTAEGTNIVKDQWQALATVVCAAERMKK